MMIPSPHKPKAPCSAIVPSSRWITPGTWNTDISDHPVDPNSDDYIASINADGDESLHADFGEDLTYGMIVADNGTSWFISSATDSRWDDEDLNQLKTVPGDAFEVVITEEIVYGD